MGLKKQILGDEKKEKQPYGGIKHTMTKRLFLYKLHLELYCKMAVDDLKE